MQIIPLGDSALIVRVCEDFEGSPDKALNAVLAAQRRLENAALPGAIELAPAYTTIALFFDPVRAIQTGAPIENVFDWLAQKIREILNSVDPAADDGQAMESVPGERSIAIPVCYELELGFDLDEVAAHTKMSVQEVIDLHCSARYRVSCVGFTPGFPFLSGLPDELATPRRSTPRKEIPAGSVAIGGRQTGIYPIKSPGGWNVIGRTPLRLFDPQKNPPAVLRAGDRVRFRAITREEFERAGE
jgi:inhibitor of KinA